MPEVFPQFESSFQKMVDEEYSGKNRLNPDRIKEYGPNGMFGIDPGNRPPQWTPSQLFDELAREYKTMVENRRAIWEDSFDQIIGIIQTTVNNYIGLLGTINSRTYMNTTEEWDKWKASQA